MSLVPKSLNKEKKLPMLCRLCCVFHFFPFLAKILKI
jgi:hypothetical protein